ncbi:hypothetical protein KR018_003616 [Drosophila ironensis]|nr:hypothetical protein KR018_003616 [Drosophila ironensis]
MDLPFGNQTAELDVLIVGAGLSGLVSAMKILEKESSLRLQVIEAADTLGGQLGVNDIFLVDGDQKEMLDFLNVVHQNTRPRRSDSLGLRRCWDLDRGLTAMPAKFELWRYVNMLEMRMSKFRSKRFNLRSRAPNMELHICNNLFFSKARNFMLSLVEIVCGVPASEVDYDVFMSVCSSCGGLQMLIDFYFMYPNSFFEVSTQQVIKKILEQMQLAEISVNCRAVKLEHFRNYVEVTDDKGNKYTAEAVILAIPWNKVERIEFQPPIPDHFLPPRAPKTGKNPHRLITQFDLNYGKPIWTELGFSGNFLSTEPLVSGHESRFSTICGYILHTPKDQRDAMDMVIDTLAAEFGDEMRRPSQCHCCTDELNVVLHKPQVQPWHRVIWSSSSTMGTTYRNLIGGAVQSGIRAAVNALFVVRPQVVSWKDMPRDRERSVCDKESPGRLAGLLSRLNLYNVTFYSCFVLGVTCLLNIGYYQAVVY